MLMINQVLSIEQMQELQDKGLDCSNASMYWIKLIETKKADPILVPKQSKEALHIIYCELDVDELISTFTLQDILTLLEPYHRLMVIRREPDEWLDSAFELLKFQLRHLEE